VAVLRGGPSVAYEDSLKTGGYILSLLKTLSKKYEPLDVFISRDGTWHYSGLAEDPHKILSRADVAWNALHGSYGESGGVQQLLSALQIPFTGSGITASILSHNKEMSEKAYHLYGLPAVRSRIISADTPPDDLVAVFQTFLHPVIVKPGSGVRAMGVLLAYTFAELKEAIEKGLSMSERVLVQEYVRGTVVSCPVLERVKEEALYAFLPVHLETEMRRVRPSPEENREIERLARLAHQSLGLRHYSSSDFIISPKGKIYLLETNSQPVFHEDSLLHQSLRSSGWRPEDYVEHCLNLAMNKN